MNIYEIFSNAFKNIIVDVVEFIGLKRVKEKLIIVLLLYSGRRNAAVPLNLQLQYRGRDISRVPADVVKIVLVINVYIYIVIFVSKK